MSASPVRVRFAPSPTGFFHIGGARTALFNWLYAQKTGGTFVLRIEDTDKERNTDEALRVLLDGMKWLGLNWDEGPEVGGPHAPYFQSQRGHIYRRYIDQLRASGRVYERDGALVLQLPGESYTAFDKFRNRDVTKRRCDPVIIDDAIRGQVERLEDEDFVIVRANGEPVFHFVNVVDDIEMGITHVIRGEDHLSNTPKHIHLFMALGAPVPKYAHIPLILKTDGPGKMSKRDKGSRVEEYRELHYLPEALRNYLCFLGWSPKDDREIMPIADIIAAFDLGGINKANAKFDAKKLSHFNALYLRQLPISTLAWTVRPILHAAGVFGEEVDETYLQEVLAICQEKISAVEELTGYVRYFFTEDYAFDQAALDKLTKKGDPAARVREALPALTALTEWTDAALEGAVQALSAAHQRPGGEYIHALRWAVSGVSVGPSLYGLLRVLGRDRVLARLNRALARLGATATS